MNDAAPVLACDLDALDPDEQARRAALAARVTADFLEVRETGDGYAARLDGGVAVARDVAEWFSLERRCCPFLRLEMRFETADDALWIAFGGGPGVKEFLVAAGLTPSAARAGAGCGC